MGTLASPLLDLLTAWVGAPPLSPNASNFQPQFSIALYPDGRKRLILKEVEAMRFSKHSYAGFEIILWLWMCILLAACSTLASTAQSTPTPTVRPTRTMVVSASCQRPSPITTSTIGQPEVQGTASKNHQLWALLFQPMVARQELKIVWRMTGNGDMQIVALGPRGETVKPRWMTYHGSSNWARPGAEWGTGFILPEGGCWDFRASRTDATGDVWMLVN